MMGLDDFFDQLAELDSSNIGSWPAWAHMGAIVTVAAIILISGSWYFVQPKMQLLAQLQQREHTLKQNFIDKHKQAARLDNYREQLTTLRNRLTRQTKQLPEHAQVSDVLRTIARIRQSCGLQGQLFKPRPAIKKEFHVIQPNAMTVTGSYRQFTRFVARITSLAHMVTIDNITMTPIRAKADPMLRISMTINIYRRIGDGA